MAKRNEFPSAYRTLGIEPVTPQKDAVKPEPVIQGAVTIVGNGVTVEIRYPTPKKIAAALEKYPGSRLLKTVKDVKEKKTSRKKQKT